MLDVGWMLDGCWRVRWWSAGGPPPRPRPLLRIRIRSSESASAPPSPHPHPPSPHPHPNPHTPPSPHPHQNPHTPPHPIRHYHSITRLLHSITLHLLRVPMDVHHRSRCPQSSSLPTADTRLKITVTVQTSFFKQVPTHITSQTHRRLVAHQLVGLHTQAFKH